MSYEPITPADEFLADLLTSANKGFADMFTKPQPTREIERLEAGVTVYRWGLIYALLAMKRRMPDQFPAFVRDLQAAWDAGDGLGEWAWQWDDEIKRGMAPTLPFLGEL